MFTVHDGLSYDLDSKDFIYKVRKIKRDDKTEYDGTKLSLATHSVYIPVADYIFEDKTYTIYKSEYRISLACRLITYFLISDLGKQVAQCTLIYSNYLLYPNTQKYEEYKTAAMSIISQHQFDLALVNEKLADLLHTHNSFGEAITKGVVKNYSADTKCAYFDRIAVEDGFYGKGFAKNLQIFAINETQREWGDLILNWCVPSDGDTEFYTPMRGRGFKEGLAKLRRLAENAGFVVYSEKNRGYEVELFLCIENKIDKVSEYITKYAEEEEPIICTIPKSYIQAYMNRSDTGGLL